MSIAKKTGLYIEASNQPIVDKVMQDYGYTKISNAINFIIREYDRLSKQNEKEVVAVAVEKVEETQIKRSLNDWFVAEDNK